MGGSGGVKRERGDECHGRGGGEGGGGEERQNQPFQKSTSKIFSLKYSEARVFFLRVLKSLMGEV